MSDHTLLTSESLGAPTSGALIEYTSEDWFPSSSTADMDICVPMTSSDPPSSFIDLNGPETHPVDTASEMPEPASEASSFFDLNFECLLDEEEFDQDLSDDERRVSNEIRRMLRELASQGSNPVLELRTRQDMERVRSVSFSNLRTRQTFLRFIRVLHVIHDLIHSNSFSTKRDLYYQDVQLFQNQGVIDRMVDDLAAHFQCSRHTLHLQACSKGLVYGSVMFYLSDGHCLDAGIGSHQGHLLPYFELVERVELDPNTRFILVIEKAATFSHLISIGFTKAFTPCVLITGKGYPDLVTRQHLAHLSKLAPNVPILAFMDGDPHGMDILRTFKFGAKSNPIYHEYNVPSLWWIGVWADEARLIPDEGLLMLTDHDRRKILSLLEKPEVKMNVEWKRQLCLMLRLNRKMEIQGLCMKDTGFLFDYFDTKLKHPETWL